MKSFAVLSVVVLLVGACSALEREDRVKEDSSEEKDIDVLRSPKVPSSDEDDDGNRRGLVTEPSLDEGDNSGEFTRCSETICRLKCQVLERCQASKCLADGRCKCTCRQAIDPLDAFFRSILSSHLEPRISMRPRLRPPQVFPEFGVLPRPPRFPDFSDMFKDFDNENVTSKVLVTLQQTCHAEEDCSSVCTNCSSTKCVDNYCQCTSCARENVESRSTNLPKTCRSARSCVEHCEGCAKTTCNYGACECSRCAAATNPPPTTESVKSTEVTTTAGGSESPAVTTSSPLETTTAPVETTTQLTEILSVRNNQTSPADSIANAEVCVPKKCNHACWERQCSKWNCNGTKCECDRCPEEVSVIVKDAADSNKQKLASDNSKYEIVF